MPLSELRSRTGFENDKRLQKGFQKFEVLLEDLQSRELPEAVQEEISDQVETLNAVPDGDPKLRKQLRKTYQSVLRILQKKLNWVPQGYYRTLWTGLGMSAFGIPLGVAFGMSLGNMAFLGIGLPIGLAIGIGVGTGMDAKAAKEGRQLNVGVG